MEPLHSQLRKARKSLIRAYVFHVVWFVAMCAFAGLQWNERGLRWSVLLALITVPPVLVYTVRVHKLCRAIDPYSRTVGWIPVLITTFVLSPFESGLVLPARNLLAANRLLREASALSAAQAIAEDGIDHSSKPTSLHNTV